MPREGLVIVQATEIDKFVYGIPIVLATPLLRPPRKRMKTAVLRNRSKATRHRYAASESSKEVTYDFGGDLRAPEVRLARAIDASDTVSSLAETSEVESSSKGAS